MIGIYFKTVKDKKFKRIESLRVGAWINVDNATKEDLQEIARITDLQPEDLQDTLDRYEVPRIERQEGSNTLIYVRHPNPDDNETHTGLLTIIVSKQYLITISQTKSDIIERILSSTLNLATTQKSKLLLNILLRVSNAYTSDIKAIRNKVLRGRKNMNNIKSTDFVGLSEIEDILNHYISALVPMNNVIEAIRTGKYISIYEEDQDILQDLLIAGKQSVDICTVNLKTITSVRESYQLIFTNNLNKIIKLFTALTIILTIPMIVASVYGMNIALPLEHNPYAFIIITGIGFLISIAVLLVFFYKKWL